MSVVAEVLLTFVVTSCAGAPTDVSTREREVTLAVVSEFINRLHPDDFSVIYLSDEFLPFSLDTAFTARFSPPGGAVRIARRDDVSISYDIMPPGVLLLEPSSIELSTRTAVQFLSFAATSDYGGQYRYDLHQDFLGRWIITRKSVVWII